MSGEDLGLEPDEWDGTTVPCNVELLTLIAKQRWVGVTLPTPELVAGWGTRSLRSGTRRSMRKAKRRAVLVKTFANLEALCATEASMAAATATKPTRSARSAKAATTKGRSTPRRK